MHRFHAPKERGGVFCLAHQGGAEGAPTGIAASGQPICNGNRREKHNETNCSTIVGHEDKQCTLLCFRQNTNTTHTPAPAPTHTHTRTPPLATTKALRLKMAAEVSPMAQTVMDFNEGGCVYVCV